MYATTKKMLQAAGYSEETVTRRLLVGRLADMAAGWLAEMLAGWRVGGRAGLLACWLLAGCCLAWLAGGVRCEAAARPRLSS